MSEGWGGRGGGDFKRIIKGKVRITDRRGRILLNGSEEVSVPIFNAT